MITKKLDNPLTNLALSKVGTSLGAGTAVAAASGGNETIKAARDRWRGWVRTGTLDRINRDLVALGYSIELKELPLTEPSAAQKATIYLESRLRRKDWLTLGMISKAIGLPIRTTAIALDGLIAEGDSIERKARGRGIFYRLKPKDS